MTIPSALMIQMALAELESLEPFYVERLKARCGRELEAAQPKLQTIPDAYFLGLTTQSIVSRYEGQLALNTATESRSHLVAAIRDLRETLKGAPHALWCRLSMNFFGLPCVCWKNRAIERADDDCGRCDVKATKEETDLKAHLAKCSACKEAKPCVKGEGLVRAASRSAMAAGQMGAIRMKHVILRYREQGNDRPGAKLFHSENCEQEAIAYADTHLLQDRNKYPWVQLCIVSETRRLL